MVNQKSRAYQPSEIPIADIYCEGVDNAYIPFYKYELIKNHFELWQSNIMPMLVMPNTNPEVAEKYILLTGAEIFAVIVKLHEDRKLPVSTVKVVIIEHNQAELINNYQAVIELANNRINPINVDSTSNFERIYKQLELALQKTDNEELLKLSSEKNTNKAILQRLIKFNQNLKKIADRKGVVITSRTKKTDLLNIIRDIES